MYDPTTGEPVSGISGSLRTILAYAKNGKSIGSGEGPLRIAFVSPEKDQVTDSDQWVKSVVSIKARLTVPARRDAYADCKTTAVTNKEEIV